MGLSLVLGIADPASPEESYELERMWPTLEQPWYFCEPEAIAVSKDGYIFISDTLQHRIVKLDPNGKVVKSAGTKGSEPGNFSSPGGITIDHDGFIYVAERSNQRIQKLTEDLELVETWPSPVNPTMVDQPQGGLTADSQGYIYHADYRDDHIYKYGPNGSQVKQWGSSGVGAGEFNGPIDIAVDQEGNIYITDYLNHRVQKFTPEGDYLDQWGGQGSDPGMFDQPKGITIDSEGYVYVCDWDRVQKFTRDGNYITQWTINQQPYAGGAAGIDASPQGILYVTTQRSVQVFTSSGVFVEEWGSRGLGPGHFVSPGGVATDNEGYIYVSDRMNGEIKMFDPHGEYEGYWLAPKAYDITILNDIVYVSSSFGNKMSMYTKSGALIKEWAVDEAVFGFDVDLNGNIYASVRMASETGSVNGLVKYDSNGVIVGGPMSAGESDVAVDRNNNWVYTLITGGYKKYDTSLNLLETYDKFGDGNGQFRIPHCIGADDDGNIYIGDWQRHDIQKLSPDGIYLATIGELGTGPADMNAPDRIWVDKAKSLYVVDWANVRIQKFKRIDVDFDGDGKTDLGDAILALKVLTRIDSTGQTLSGIALSGADVNGDKKIGIEEVIYIFQKVSELR